MIIGVFFPQVALKCHVQARLDGEGVGGRLLDEYSKEVRQRTEGVQK